MSGMKLQGIGFVSREGYGNFRLEQYEEAKSRCTSMEGIRLWRIGFVSRNIAGGILIKAELGAGKIVVWF